jgi:transcription elongation factor Elf1
VFVSLLDAGDVQSAFHLAMVIGVSRLSAHSSFPDKTIKRWCVHYLDLLSSMQLWTIRNRIIRSVPWEDVRDLGKKNTTFHANCPNCNSNLSPDSWFCKTCKRVVAVCGVCHLPVRVSVCCCGAFRLTLFSFAGTYDLVSDMWAQWPFQMHFCVVEVGSKTLCGADVRS